MRAPRNVADVREAARKAANVAELLELRSDRAALELLEEAVGENARLADELEMVVSRLEQALVPLLERALGVTSTRPADPQDAP